MELFDPYPKETFKTKYMAEFKGYNPYNSLNIEPKLYQKNTRPMNLDTSNKEDYKKHPVNPSQPIYPIDNSAPTRPALANSTINTYNYPPWGTLSVLHEKRWHPPVRTTELPFKGRSSYHSSYSPINQRDAKKFSTDFTKSTAFSNNLALGPKMGLDDRTTYGQKMRNYSGSGLNTRIQVRVPEAMNVMASPSNFRTTSNFYYANEKKKRK